MASWKASIGHSCVDVNGRNVTTNETCFLDLLNEVVWPTFRSPASRIGYWWKQDGASAHYTTEAKGFLVEKFRSKVTSRVTKIRWPAHSSDLHSLEAYSWALSQRRVCATKPFAIAGVIDVVEQFASESSKDVLRDVALEVLERVRLCLEVKGGHCQYLKKNSKR